MCRFTLYLGHPIRLSSLLFEPQHSLILQSTHSAEREEPLNGDGFGVGWYAPDLCNEPAVFRSISPAWNNRNLASLSRVMAAPTILAHVRAATQLSSVNEANCHPFRWGRYLFAHNGDVGEFSRLRRRLLESVSDVAFANVFGSTDSEHVFALVIDELANAPRADPAAHMAHALARAIERVLELSARHTGGEPCWLNLALTDGRHAAVSRFSSDPAGQPESLYWFRGELYDPFRGDGAELPLVVASERLTDDPQWQEVPPGHIVMLRPGLEPELAAWEALVARRLAA